MTANLSSSHKFVALDAIRGVAALMVVMQHLWEMSYPSQERLKPWLLLYAGHEALILFFVLSGLVLAHQLRGWGRDSLGWRNYWRFSLRRWLRIYPAYYLFLAASAVILIKARSTGFAVSTQFGLTPWFQIWSHTFFDRSMWLGSLSLISHQGNSLNVATWTLFVEMWLSLIFPGLLILVVKSGFLWRSLTLGLLSGISYYWWQRGQWLDNEWQSLSYYCWYFLLGVLLYQFYPRWHCLARMPWLIIGLMAYFCNFLLLGNITSRLVHELIIAFGSSLILINGIHNHGFKRMLATALFRYYGKISYSLYLCHLPVLYGLVYCLLPRLHWRPNWLIMLGLELVSASLVASISYYIVELPAIKLSRALIK